MELTYEEIAQVLNCSVGTVKSRLSRGRNILRKSLADRELLPSTPRQTTEEEN
jgi:RNA polymerase sigma-70 factor (ECF subfamily)